MAGSNQNVEYVKKQLQLPAAAPLPPLRPNSTTVADATGAFERGDIILIVQGKKIASQAELFETWAKLQQNANVRSKTVVVYRADYAFYHDGRQQPNLEGGLHPGSYSAQQRLAAPTGVVPGMIPPGGASLLPQMRLSVDPVRLPQQDSLRDAILSGKPPPVIEMTSASNSSGAEDDSHLMAAINGGNKKKNSSAAGTRNFHQMDTSTGSGEGATSSSSSMQVTTSSGSEEEQVLQRPRNRSSTALPSQMSDVLASDWTTKNDNSNSSAGPSGMQGGMLRQPRLGVTLLAEKMFDEDEQQPGGAQAGAKTSLQEYLNNSSQSSNRAGGASDSFLSEDLRDLPGFDQFGTGGGVGGLGGEDQFAVNGSPIRSIQTNSRHAMFGAGPAKTDSTWKEPERASDVLLKNFSRNPRTNGGAPNKLPSGPQSWTNAATAEDGTDGDASYHSAPPRQIALYSLSEELRALSSSVKMRLSDEAMVHPSQGGLGGDNNPTSTAGRKAGTAAGGSADAAASKECAALDERALMMLKQAEQNLALSDFARQLKKIAPELRLLNFPDTSGTLHGTARVVASEEGGKVEFGKLAKYIEGLEDRNGYLISEFEKQATNLRKKLLHLLGSTARQTALEERWGLMLRAYNEKITRKNITWNKSAVSSSTKGGKADEEKVALLLQQLQDLLEEHADLFQLKSSAHQQLYDMLPDREKRKLFSHLQPQERNAIRLTPWELTEFQRTGAVAVKDARDLPPTLLFHTLTQYLQRAHFDVAKDLAGDLPDEFLSPYDRGTLAGGDFEILTKNVIPALLQRADAGVEVERLVLHAGLLSQSGVTAVMQELGPIEETSGSASKSSSKNLGASDADSGIKKDSSAAAVKEVNKDMREIAQKKVRLILRRAAEEAREASAARDRLAALLNGPARSLIAEELSPGLPALVEAVEKAFTARQAEFSTLDEEKRSLGELHGKKQTQLDALVMENRHLKQEVQNRIKQLSDQEHDFDAKEHQYRLLFEQERGDRAALRKKLEVEKAKHHELQQKSSALLRTLEAANQELTGLHRRASEKIDICADLRTALSESLAASGNENGTPQLETDLTALRRKTDEQHREISKLREQARQASHDCLAIDKFREELVAYEKDRRHYQVTLRSEFRVLEEKLHMGDLKREALDGGLKQIERRVGAVESDLSGNVMESVEALKNALVREMAEKGRELTDLKAEMELKWTRQEYERAKVVDGMFEAEKQVSKVKFIVENTKEDLAKLSKALEAVDEKAMKKEEGEKKLAFLNGRIDDVRAGADSTARKLEQTAHNLTDKLKTATDLTMLNSNTLVKDAREEFSGKLAEAEEAQKKVLAAIDEFEKADIVTHLDRFREEVEREIERHQLSARIADTLEASVILRDHHERFMRLLDLLFESSECQNALMLQDEKDREGLSLIGFRDQAEKRTHDARGGDAGTETNLHRDAKEQDKASVGVR
eukprot:g2719.t1